MEREHVLVALVEDEPGVMQRISGMFTRRHFNIDTISVGHTEKEGISRMTITFWGDDKKAEQIIKQLNRIIEVIKVMKMDRDSIQRELALIKLNTSDAAVRREIIEYTNIFRAKIVDVGKDSMIVEVTGDPDKVDAFVKLVTPFGIKELAVAGMTAMNRGSKPQGNGK
ncbi:MAG: acetolactate synthase small subunit [Methanobacteriota archaeon]|nr:MAG: acetolactate synthase small subunit [Euryarchaeota archaeon]